MKKLSKINLSNLGQAEMQKKEMSMIRGGGMMETEAPVIPTDHYCFCQENTCSCRFQGTVDLPDDVDWGNINFDNQEANMGDVFTDVANME